LAVSLVAEVDGQIVGHVAFSPVEFSDNTPNWFGLGPVAVLPEWQRRGIGKALIERGLAELRTLGAAGCAVLGNPGYYRRFGFQQRPACFFEGVPPGYFQLLAFGPNWPCGKVLYHQAFGGTA
jgi:putative acetyltransferase